MNAYKLQILGIHDSGQSIPCLSVFEIKTKAIPFWINTSVHVHSDSHPWFQIMSSLRRISEYNSS